MTDKTRPSSFGGPGGLSDERPPVTWDDAELDKRAEKAYNDRMAAFELADYLRAKPVKKKRRFIEYTTRNCEEAWGGRAAGSSADHVV